MYLRGYRLILIGSCLPFARFYCKGKTFFSFVEFILSYKQEKIFLKKTQQFTKSIVNISHDDLRKVCVRAS